MFNDTDGGGFFNADNSFGGGSPQVPKKGDQKRAQNVMPVTAKQVLSSPEDGLKIGNLEVYLVTLVGIVRSVESTSVKVTYSFEDNTGMVEGVHWIDGDENGQSAQPQVVENTYCRLSGTIRSQGEKRFVMAFNIQPIEDFNEITTHFLEVALFAKKAETMSSSGVMDTHEDNTMSNENGNKLSNSLMTSSGGQNDMSGLDPSYTKILSVIQSCQVENGIHVDSVIDQLKGQVPKAQVVKSIEFLCCEGHVYTTIDDNHFRSTEGM